MLGIFGGRPIDQAMIAYLLGISNCISSTFLMEIQTDLKKKSAKRPTKDFICRLKNTLLLLPDVTRPQSLVLVDVLMEFHLLFYSDSEWPTSFLAI